MARRAQQGDPLSSEFDGFAGATVIALPIRHRHRIIGSLTACTLTRDTPDAEAFARFCSLHEVDRLVFERLAAPLPHTDAIHLPAYTELISQQIESLSTSALTTRDVHNLSTHLAQMYEELHLIYRVGTEMAIFKPAETHFEKLCDELMAGTVVENVAVVLEPAPGEPATQPTIVRRGPLQHASEDIARLYHQVRDLPRNADPALVINNPSTTEGLEWTIGWLNQFIFCELARNDRRFGGILALNHTTGQDFGSYEIQLLNAVAERSAAFIESAQLYDDLERLFIGMLHALVSSIDAKDPYTCGHSQRVAWLSRHLARLAKVPEPQCNRVYLAGLLHDIGKIGISESVLRKTGHLTDDEFNEIKRHPAIGARILDGVPNVADLIPGIIGHHEWVNGTGYPGGLKGDDIPFFGRLIGLADSFDAMTTDRTYRKARPIDLATAEIRKCAGTQFDLELADLLVGEDLNRLSQEMEEFGEQPIRPAPWNSLGEIRGGGT